MLHFITSNLLWTQGTALVIVLILCALLGLKYSKTLLYFSFGFFIFSFYFFRSPERFCFERLRDDAVIVSPCDGKVVEVQYNTDTGIEGYPQRVSIFLSPFDAHVNWVPVDGIVESITYYPGKYMLAFLPKSSLLNEHNDVVIRTKYGQKIKIRQIAGLVARRIVTWVTEGQDVQSGQKYGMIKFGSRVDLFLPASVHVNVSVGQRVYGGQTVLGRLFK